MLKTEPTIRAAYRAFNACDARSRDVIYDSRVRHRYRFDGLVRRWTC